MKKPDLKPLKGKMFVGLTGSPASGKTRAARRFAALGAEVICADSLAKAALRKGRPAYKAVLKRFGPAALSPGGELDRAYLAGRIFRSAGERRRLERLVHPEVLREGFKIARASGKKVAVFDVPLLFEAGTEELFDLTAAVCADKETRRRRAVRRGWSAAEFAARDGAQLPGPEKSRRADVVIDNSSSLKRLYKQIDRLYFALKMITQE